MKCLSLWEPWATLMALGAKKIETRSWYTDYRGFLAIHASKGGLNRADLESACCDGPFYRALREYPPFAEKIAADARRKGWISEVFPHGCIVAVAHLSMCLRTNSVVTYSPEILTDDERAFGDYSEGRYAWITSHLYPLNDPLPFKARQGLFDLSADTVAEIRKRITPRVR